MAHVPIDECTNNEEEIIIKYSADIKELREQLIEVNELLEKLQKNLIKLGLSINLIVDVDSKNNG